MSVARSPACHPAGALYDPVLTPAELLLSLQALHDAATRARGAARDARARVRRFAIPAEAALRDAIGEGLDDVLRGMDRLDEGLREALDQAARIGRVLRGDVP